MRLQILWSKAWQERFCEVADGTVMKCRLNSVIAHTPTVYNFTTIYIYIMFQYILKYIENISRFSRQRMRDPKQVCCRCVISSLLGHEANLARRCLRLARRELSFNDLCHGVALDSQTVLPDAPPCSCYSSFNAF